MSRARAAGQQPHGTATPDHADKAAQGSESQTSQKPSVALSASKSSVCLLVGRANRRQSQQSRPHAHRRSRLVLLELSALGVAQGHI